MTMIPTMRTLMMLCEMNDLLSRITKIAQACDNVETFIRKTDGEDVLYRGHTGDHVANNSFMTDYVGHAGEYAGDEGRIDAFAFNPADVFYYDDASFNEMRNTYRELSGKQLAAIYKNSVAAEQFGPQLLAKVKRILRGNVPYSKISDHSMMNDLLIPLLQTYASTHGKNIIAFHGSDYADYGGQTEYVVGDVSKLVDLRQLYAKVHQNELRETITDLMSDPKFRKWFRGSEVTDWEGNPLEVYHGTDGKFNRFDPAYFGKRSGGVAGTGIKGYYFYGSVGDDEQGIAKSSARAWGKNVMHCYLRMTNPFISDKLPDGVTEQKALDAGHDGIILRGGGLYVVFHPDQIWITQNDQ